MSSYVSSLVACPCGATATIKHPTKDFLVVCSECKKRLVWSSSNSKWVPLTEQSKLVQRRFRTTAPILTSAARPVPHRPLSRVTCPCGVRGEPETIDRPTTLLRCEACGMLLTHNQRRGWFPFDEIPDDQRRLYNLASAITLKDPNRQQEDAPRETGAVGSTVAKVQATYNGEAGELEIVSDGETVSIRFNGASIRQEMRLDSTTGNSAELFGNHLRVSGPAATLDFILVPDGDPEAANKFLGALPGVRSHNGAVTSPGAAPRPSEASFHARPITTRGSGVNRPSGSLHHSQPQGSSGRVAGGIAVLVLLAIIGAVIVGLVGVGGKADAKRWIESVYTKADIEWSCINVGNSAAALDWYPEIGFSLEDMRSAWRDLCR